MCANVLVLTFISRTRRGVARLRFFVCNSDGSRAKGAKRVASLLARYYAVVWRPSCLLSSPGRKLGDLTRQTTTNGSLMSPIRFSPAFIPIVWIDSHAGAREASGSDVQGVAPPEGECRIRRTRGSSEGLVIAPLLVTSMQKDGRA